MTPYAAYTRRRRVGLLMIPDEIVAAEEIRTLLPVDGLAYQQHRVEFEEVDTPANRAAALTSLSAAVRTIGRTRPELVAFACTSGGAFAGAQFHDQLLQRMRAELPNAEVTTAVDAVARVLAAAGATRIAMGTPYADDTAAAVRDVLAARGITVVRTARLFEGGYPGPWTVMSTPPDTVAELARRIDDDRADAVFVSCTGLPSTPVIADVERGLGKPFLTSNIAIARSIQCTLGLGSVRGYGSILATD